MRTRDLFPAALLATTKAEENLAEGLELIENGEGSYGVREEQVVQVGESYYSTLGRALANAQEGETVKLLKDITLDKTLSIDGKSFTLDLNGRTISGSVATTQVNKINTSGLLCVGSGSTVTITDLSEGERRAPSPIPGQPHPARCSSDRAQA